MGKGQGLTAMVGMVRALARAHLAAPQAIPEVVVGL